MSDSSLPNDPSALREELQDRLADLALSEVVGGHKPPDLSQVTKVALPQSAATWRRGAKIALAASLLIAISIVSFGWWRWRDPYRQPQIGSRATIDQFTAVDGE